MVGGSRVSSKDLVRSAGAGGSGVNSLTLTKVTAGVRGLHPFVCLFFVSRLSHNPAFDSSLSSTAHDSSNAQIGGGGADIIHYNSVVL